jgi:hypothetical protein
MAVRFRTSTMNPLRSLCLLSLIALVGCASTSESKKFFHQNRGISVETQYRLNNVQGLNPLQIKAEEESRWRIVEPSVRSYESSFHSCFKTVCTLAAEEKNVAPLYDYADVLRAQDRALHALGEQNGLTLISEVKLPTGESMPIPDYVQHTAHEAASIIKKDTDNELSNSETSHHLSNIFWNLALIGRALR